MMPDNVDPVVPEVLGQVLPPAHPVTRWEILRRVLLTITLLLASVFSVLSFVLTQIYNDCQTHATNQLRGANNSDRAAQDKLDAQLLDPSARVRTRAEADQVYAEFKATRAANDAKRAQANGKC